jgi:hypothetical protein
MDKEQNVSESSSDIFLEEWQIEKLNRDTLDLYSEGTKFVSRSSLFILAKADISKNLHTNSRTLS